jgi:hypothetical protein
MSLIAIQDGNYIVNLHAGQSEAWNSKKRWIAVLAGTQGGKALAVDTPIPVPGGFKPMGSLVLGDKVLGSDRLPCTIVGMSPVYFNHYCYRVILDDGSSVVADEDHLWETQTYYGLIDVITTRKLSGTLNLSHSLPSDPAKRTIVAVEPCPSVPVKCIAVDSPDRLYLCSESFIPTHNTSFGPLWLWREIQARGPGDYLAVTATFDLFKLKMLPALRELFIDVLGIARYWVSDRILEIKDPKTGSFWATTKDDPMYCRIILRSADAYGGLEAATAKAAWIDEAGLIPDALPWEATQRRLAINLGRALITTTLYDFAWLKRVIYDPWERSHHKHPDIDVISFDSIANPSFPKEEWERAMREMEAWKFDMMYRGRYSRPFGMIYQAFNAKRHVMSRMGFDVPRTWPRFLGLDFGGANLAGVFLAQDPLSRRVYAYRTYLDGHRGVREHVEALLNGEPFPIAVGGAGSEDQWRRDFAVAGLPVQAPPIRDVEVGITRVHSFFKQDKIIVFDHLHPYIDQIGSYSRVVDKATGEVTEKIRNKEMYHYLDATRYILSYLYGAGFLTPESIGSGGAFVAQSYINEACQ